MSLAMYAAPFNENSENNNSNRNGEESFINKKRQNQPHNQTHNKTQKRYPKEGFDSEKVNTLLEKMHNSDETESSNLGDFNPPPNPESSGVQKTIATEQMQTMLNNNNQNMFKVLGKAPLPNPGYTNGDSSLDLNNFNMNYGDSKSVEDYYKKFLPNYSPQRNPINRPHYSNINSNMMESYGGEQDVLLKKLNYMITLLEEQQDEKTGNVTEEVVLYSFLGIFIIFIVDSFSRVGKYVR